MRLKITILSAVLFCSSTVFAASPNQPTFDERLFDAKIAAVIAKIEAVHTRINAMDTALKLKEQENERRLEGLNELRGDVVKDRDQYVRKDMYDQKVKEYDEAVKRLADLESQLIAWVAAIGVGFSLVVVGVHLWGLRRKTRARYPEDDRSG